MWLQFALACVIALIVIFPLGIFVTSTLRLSLVGALATAPLVSVFILSISSLALDFTGTPANPISVGITSIGIALLVRLAITLIFRKRHCEIQPSLVSESSPQALAIIVGSCTFAAFITVFVFAVSIESPSSLMQSSDAVFHLAKVETFIQSSTFSFFHDPYYATQQEATYQLSSSFYPSAWHVICALIAQCSGMNVPLSANAENIIVAGAVFPLSSAFLVSQLSNENAKITALGALASTAFVSFPWGEIIWGPLFPNALSFSMLPAFMGLFVSCFRGCIPKALIAQRVTVLLIGALSLALAQPNVIFSAVLLLLPFCIATTWEKASKRFGYVASLSLSSCIGIVFVAFWAWCYRSPIFAGVVSFNWPAINSTHRALFDALTYGMNGIPCEPVLAILTICGFYTLLKSKQHRWLFASWLIVILQYTVCTSQDTILKSFLCGFWYSDAHRIAANVVIISIPIIAFGLAGLIQKVVSSIESKKRGKHEPKSKPAANVITAGLLAFTAIAVYGPFSLPEPAPVKTNSYSFLHHVLKDESSDDHFQVLTNEELRFAQKALSLIPQGSLIINSPNDGSCFLYSADDANVMYRALSLPDYPEEESKAGREIRKNLIHISTDNNIRQDVEELDAHYVLLLDQGKRDDEFRLYFWSYYPDQWEGIETITDNTPGFTVVLAERDMRLYRIDDSN